MESDSRLRQAVEQDDVKGILRQLERSALPDSTPDIPCILELLSHRSFAIREAAVRTAGVLRIPEAVEHLLRMTDNTIEKDRHVRLQAVRALGSIEGPAVTQALQSALGDPALNVRAAAEDILNRNNGCG